jgi:peptidoglycan/LPS O-acetylase OafA/YrhL
MRPNEHPHNNFDFVRILAAFCVIVSHQFALGGLREPSVLNVHSLGGFGVLVFFSISGYLVSKSWEADPNALRFLLKRFLRIWPGLAVVVVLAAFVLGPFVSDLSLRDYYSHPLIWEYLKNLQFNLRDELPLSFVGNALPGAVNGSVWTIPIEVKCYALLGLIGVVGLLKFRWVIPALTVVAVIAYAVVEPRGDKIITLLGLRPEQRFSLEFGLFFFAGVIFHKLDVESSIKRQRWALALCLGAALVAYALQRPFLALWLAVPMATLFIGTASTPYIRQTGRFGDVSYGLYLYAFPVQQTLFWLYKDTLSWAALLVLVSAITLCLAFASWHLVEKVALRLKPSRSTPIDITGWLAVFLMGAMLFR